MSPLDADELFAYLDRHGVRYVLIGGLAAVLHGSPLLTSDADICPARDPDNLIRLAAALDDLDARIRAGGSRLRARRRRSLTAGTPMSRVELDSGAALRLTLTSRRSCRRRLKRW